MELRKEEMVVLADVINDASEIAVREISELELALVGGGIGDVILA